MESILRGILEVFSILLATSFYPVCYDFRHFKWRRTICGTRKKIYLMNKHVARTKEEEKKHLEIMNMNVNMCINFII